MHGLLTRRAEPAAVSDADVTDSVPIDFVRVMGNET